MLRPSPNHRTQRLPNDDDDDAIAENSSCSETEYTSSRLVPIVCTPVCTITQACNGLYSCFPHHIPVCTQYLRIIL